MSLVYDQFKIDSARFQTSNVYYMSKIDLYEEIFEDAKASLEKEKKIYDDINTRRDSIRNDSLNKVREIKKNTKKKDSLVSNKKDFKVKNAL
jgi:predicted Holliday junction resolvase-like endonuclease